MKFFGVYAYLLSHLTFDLFTSLSLLRKLRLTILTHEVFHAGIE